MNRESMLHKLSNVKFELIDPDSSWEDVGFTERPIWVNSKGYGYIACDEPITWWEGPGIAKEQWVIIRQKLEDDSLTLKDIKGTSLIDMLDEIFFGDFDEDEYDLCNALSGILDLPTEQVDHIFCMDTIVGIQFFTTEEDFKKAYERDWCDYCWEELDDEALMCWINRLIND